MEENLIASLVFLGYPYTDKNLNILFNHDEILKNEKFVPADSFRFEGNIIPPKEFIENLKNNAPVKVYQNKDKTIRISLIKPEQKLILEFINKFNANFKHFKDICKQFIQDDIESIFTLGLNFNEHCKSDKLHLFDDEIGKIKGWNDEIGYNDGFQLVLPLKDRQDKNLTSTYTIFKENKDNEESEEKRVYIIDVNFNYNLQDRNVSKKDFLENFINVDIDKYYEKYQKNRDIILTIGQKNVK